ncbi:hypothetical protein CK203_077403 [Vitis vinifera]|uniref:RNA polymerase I-specific transcription initiation factor RRN3 n=1 Tax=Vitis vinifera TaxID=29760 RepID=A0A438D239_VITVI|nr:hypothetical protein CK203_077403 [Vitis vinifera]
MLHRGSLSRKSLGGNLIAEKLDSLMVLTFEHLESCEAGGRLIEVFETLVLSFQTTVLNAFKSKFAQFVMFYACALDPENCGVRFARVLADFLFAVLFHRLTGNLDLNFSDGSFPCDLGNVIRTRLSQIGPRTLFWVGGGWGHALLLLSEMDPPGMSNNIEGHVPCHRSSQRCILDIFLPKVLKKRTQRTSNKLLCPNLLVFERMSAVAYLASYLSRGKFLTASFVANILERLVVWCLEYCKIHDGDINPKAHQVFYSGCQEAASFLKFNYNNYIAEGHHVCALLPNEVNDECSSSQITASPFASGDNLEASIKSIEGMPTIHSGGIPRQAKAARLFTVSETFIFSDLLESELSRAFGGIERLDMFFPFDPCLLKKCDRFIRPNFVYWSMIRTTYDDGEDSSDEEPAEDYEASHPDDVMNDDAMARSYDSHDLELDEFDHSMNKMSITPKNSLYYRFGDELKVQMPSRIRPSTSPESL